MDYWVFRIMIIFHSLLLLFSVTWLRNYNCPDITIKNNSTDRRTLKTCLHISTLQDAL
jgi:hypothetical protein